jgi:hypothetical protein
MGSGGGRMVRRILTNDELDYTTKSVGVDGISFDYGDGRISANDRKWIFRCGALKRTAHSSESMRYSPALKFREGTD